MAEQFREVYVFENALALAVAAWRMRVHERRALAMIWEYLYQ